MRKRGESVDAPWSVGLRSVERRKILRGVSAESPFFALKNAVSEKSLQHFEAFRAACFEAFCKVFSCKMMLSGQISTKQSQHGFRRQLLHATAKTSAIIWLFAGFFVPLHAQYQKASLPEPT